MKEKLKTILKWRFVRALQIWNRLPIRAQGGVTVFIPIVAVMVSFAFAIYGNLNRAARQDDIQRKFTAVRQYGDLLTLLVDAETGERGFLLTGRNEYLEPYRRAVAEIPQTIEQLKATVENEPGDKPRTERLAGLATIQNSINLQLALLKESQTYAPGGKNADEISVHLGKGKFLMDEIRREIARMQNREATLLGDRIEEINSIRNRDYIVVFIVLLVGVLVRVISFYLFDRGIVRRIRRLTAYVDEIIKGEPTNYALSKKTDAIGDLEEKICELGERIKNKTLVAAD